MAGAPAQAYVALVAATVPFLAVNLPPARAFMGDVGAVPLGFLAAVFGLAGMARRHLAGLVSAARVPAVRGRRDRDAVAPGALAASAFGRRTGRTTTSGSTRWARGIAALSPSMAV